MKALLGVLGAAAVGGLLYAATLSHSSVECEACVAFGGETVCRSVSGGSHNDAAARAVANACSILAGNITEVVRCQATPPRSMRCRDR